MFQPLVAPQEHLLEMMYQELGSALLSTTVKVIFDLIL
jgi:hypothetical protein